MTLYSYLMRKKATIEPAVETAEMATKKKPVRRTTRKKATPAAVEEEAPAPVEVKKEEVAETPKEEPQVETTAQDAQSEAKETIEAKDAEIPAEKQTQIEASPAPAERPVPKIRKIATDVSNIRDFCDLANQGARIPLLNDQQIQQLTYEEALERNILLEKILRQVLDYDIVLSDTNIWLELLVGHTSSHSDPRVNARLQFERQLEFISKMMKRIGGKFMIMSETYEEIDRFATVLDPVSYKDVDWNDEVLCRNVSARLAKKLMLAEQKENRLRIEGIGSESHHSAFADPAIIRRTVEFFAEGKKVLLLTNDASVGIRSLGMCDDMQRTNRVDDTTWREVYEPQRPMVLTMDDLKLLDQYTRQYYFLLMPAGRQWMQDVSMREPVALENPLKLWMDGFRAGDRHERRSDRIEQQRKEQQRKEQQRIEKEQKEQERKDKLQKEKDMRDAQQKAEQERRETQQKVEQERREAQQKAEQERREAQQKAEQQRKANQSRNDSRRKGHQNDEKENVNPASETTSNQTANLVPENPKTQNEEKGKKKTGHSSTKKAQKGAEKKNEAIAQPIAELPTEGPKETEETNADTPAENETKKKTRPTRRGGGRRRSSSKNSDNTAS